MVSKKLPTFWKAFETKLIRDYIFLLNATHRQGIILFRSNSKDKTRF